MITPTFKLSQDENTVTITIRAPYCNLRELEVCVEETVFIFYCSPYYLRLILPGAITEDKATKSSFDADSGEFSFTFEKVNPGEHFPDLDLIINLLPSKDKVTENSGEIIFPYNEETPRTNEELNKDFGFALMGKRNFHHISSEFQDVFEIDPKEVNLMDRHRMRLQEEQGKFNTEHYIADYVEDEEIQEIISLKSPLCDLKKDDIQFTDSELSFLKNLPNTSYNLSEIQVNYCHCCLIDILYAYCYDRRSTYFEGSSESGWNIVKLAASFCWLDVFKEPREALVSVFRRSLIYPLYRNFNLCETVFTDLKQLLRLGEKYIIKCLIEMYHIFLKGDCCRYIINNLFINDYIIYVMKWDRSKWSDVISTVNNIVIVKKDLGLNLEELEDGTYDMVGALRNFCIKDDDSDDTECDSESSSDDSDSQDE